MIEDRMSARSVVLIVLGLLLGAIAADLLLTRTLLETRSGMSASGTATSGKVAIGGPFSLTDTSGRHVTEKEFAGKPMLVYFGYTNCPDICPAGLQIISQALDRIGPKVDGLSILFVTLDPERDTEKVLGEFVKSFHPKIVGLTGTTEEVDAAAKAYRVYHKKVEDAGSGGRYSVDHTGFMYLMDKDGLYLQHFPHNVTVDNLADSLGKHL
jgi:protein SCO1/2